MTCIVGYTEKGVTYIGGDSGGFSDWNMCVRKDPKVFKLKNGFVIGFSGSFRAGQILMYKFSPEPYFGTMDLHEYMVKYFVPGMCKSLDDNKVSAEDREFFSILVGYVGRLFEIGHDLQVGELESTAIGCASESARGALHAMKYYEMAPITRVEAALEAADACSGGVSPPFNILSTEE